MKKSIFLLIPFLFLLSCSKKGTQFKIDPVLSPYYDSFLASGKMRGQDVSTDNLIIEFGNAQVKSEHALAYCGRDFKSEGERVLGTEVEYNTPKVVVDREYFQLLSEVERRAVMFHELGHCLLKREHTVAVNEYRYIKSIMYPYLLTHIIGYYYDALEENYIDELFNPNAPTRNPDIALGEYFLRLREEYDASNPLPPPPPVAKMTTDSTVVSSLGLDGRCSEDEIPNETLKKMELEQ
jgi:hypothetical protein